MKLRRALAPCLGITVFASAVIACGGSSGSDLFTNADSTIGQKAEDPSSTATGGPGASSPSAPSAPDATAEPGPDGSTNTTDAGPEAPPPGPSGKIRCGNGACEAGSEVCCATYVGQGKTLLQCKGAANGCGFGLKIACDDRTDCVGGQVCCGARENGSFLSVSCRATCEGSDKEPATRLCDPKAGTDECAAIGKECKSGDLGYSVCR